MDLAGAIPALIDIVSLIPIDIHAAIILVPHLLPAYKSNFGDILAKHTSVPIFLAESGMYVEPQNIYVLPENTIMVIHHGQLFLRKRRKDEGVNKAIDIFFTSLADDVRDKAIAVILSGCGHDGLLGATEIHKNNGLVIVQDPETAQFPFMPQGIIKGDSPDYILSPKEIVSEILVKLSEPKDTGV